MDIVSEEGKGVFPPDSHWRRLISWLLFLCLTTPWRGAGIWTELKKRKGMTMLDVGCGKHSPLTLVAKHYRLKQKHKSVWSLEEVKTRDFNIRGTWLKGMGGQRWNSLFPSILRPVQYAIHIVAALFAYFFPKIASGVVAWKERA